MPLFIFCFPSLTVVGVRMTVGGWMNSAPCSVFLQMFTHRGSLRNVNLSVLFCSSVPRSAPKNLRVSEEWYNRFRISWEAPPTPTKGYRVVYQPLSGE